MKCQLVIITNRVIGLIVMVTLSTPINCYGLRECNDERLSRTAGSIFRLLLDPFAADRNASAKSSIGQPTDDGVINIKLPQILFNS